MFFGEIVEVKCHFICSWNVTQNEFKKFADVGEHQLVGVDDAVLADDGGVAHLSVVTVELIP